MTIPFDSPSGSARAPIREVEIVHLGDELLLGLRDNTHLTFLGRYFSNYGIKIRRDQVILDKHEDIVRFFGDSWGSSDLVITTGGLGPTVDDITREALAECIGLPLEFNEGIRAAIEARFERFGRKMTENNLRQCWVLKGAEILENPNGTAPGLFLEKDGRYLVMLPGPSRELQPMVAEVLMPKLLAKGLVSAQNPFIQLRTCGIGESMLETKVKPLLDEHPWVEVAYCAHSSMIVDLRLACLDPARESALDQLASDVAKLLGEDLVGYGECTLAKRIHQYLVANEQTVSVAESCTGGMLAAALTEHSGASKAFVGGVVSYTNEAKVQMLDVPECMIQQHGPVSAEVAIAMATGAAERLGSNYALSITGFAGPDGGTDKDPVGTVYIGYHSPSGAWSTRIVLMGDRATVRQRATFAALDFMRRKLIAHKADDFMRTCC